MSGDPPDPSSEVPEPRIVPEPYDPHRRREGVRTWLAIAFTGLFAALTVGPLGAIVFGWVAWSDIEGLMTLTIGSVVGIVGTVVGFYYGSQQKGS